MILTPLLKLPKNGEDWGKLIVAKGFKKLPKIQNIAKSGHTGSNWFLEKFLCAVTDIQLFFSTGSVKIKKELMQQRPILLHKT